MLTQPRQKQILTRHNVVDPSSILSGARNLPITTAPLRESLGEETEMIGTDLIEVTDVAAIEPMSSATTATGEVTLLGIAQIEGDQDLETETEMLTEGAEEADLHVMTTKDAHGREDQEVGPAGLMTVTTDRDQTKITTEIEEPIDTIGTEEIEEVIDSMVEEIKHTEIEITTRKAATETETIEEMIEVIETEEEQIDLLIPGKTESTRREVTDPDLLLKDTETTKETTEVASLKRTIDLKDQLGQEDLSAEDQTVQVQEMANNQQTDGRMKTARNLTTNPSPEMETGNGTKSKTRINQTAMVLIQKQEVMLIEQM